MPEKTGSHEPSLSSLRSRLRRLSRTLTFRVVAFSSIWAIVALVVIATVISTLFSQASRRGFENVLSAHIFNLIASVSASDAGWLVGSPNLGDLRFSEPLSGWYWAVEPASEALRNPLHSASLSGAIPAPSTEEIPFGRGFQRRYLADGPGGEKIEVLEAEVELGQEDRIARFRVMGNYSELEREIADFRRRLFLYLGLFGLGMVAINVFAILIALGPLRSIRTALANIRAGTAERLSGPFPAEIAPLAEETNALIESNRRIVERSRTQVGNLAHSLKTPLAVLMNEGRTIGGEKGSLISGQSEAMQKQIDHYLQRARVAAQRSTLAQRAPVNETLERLARVMQKLSPDKELSVDLPEERVVFAGEREDLEEITGNLLENAMKWAKGRVLLKLVPPEPDAEQHRFRIVIEDDGPGIHEKHAREALKRGRRLDETKPGTGLGLAIVADLVKEYDGTLALDRSALGGLRAEVMLSSA